MQLPAGTGTGRTRFATLVDAHVHIYDCFDLSLLLEAAWKNMQLAANQLGVPDLFAGVLMLAETRQDHWYERVRQYAECGQACDGWRFEQLSENDVALRARRGDDELLIVAGRQIVTEEGLEVLALATDKMLTDGQPVADVIERIRDEGGVAVIPWAVGKWLGQRGEIVHRLLNAATRSPFLLGDNGGRPLFWRYPSHFKHAHGLNIKVLPGTDPLPLRHDAQRVGSYGFVLRQRLSDARPADDLRRLLLHPEVDVEKYGDLQGPFRFFRNQLGLRIR
ncbi:MAG: hypothetical protein ACR2RB_06655 [Gammaproteobacteria bacterium]